MEAIGDQPLDSLPGRLNTDLRREEGPDVTPPAGGPKKISCVVLKKSNRLKKSVFDRLKVAVKGGGGEGSVGQESQEQTWQRMRR